jgi:predicted GIY-YIG superfamily endonuclease
MKKDCSRAVFYKFVKKDDTTQIYVGSTTQTLTERLTKHKNDAKKYPNRKFY